MNDEHYGHRAGVIHTEIESRTAKKKELEKEKQNVLEKLEKARGTDAQARQKLIDTQSLIAEYTDEIEQCKKEIMELLGRLRVDTGISCIFICHNLALVQEFCDRVLVMKDGRIVEEGTPDDVICNPQDEYTKMLVEAVL